MPLMHCLKFYLLDVGEVTQLQQELQNQERSRDSLAKELTEMINTNQELSHRLDRLETLLQEYEDLKTKYNALLQVTDYYCLRLQGVKQIPYSVASAISLMKTQNFTVNFSMNC